MNFEELGVKAELIRALKEEGIVEPTLIQEKTIPLIREGKDLVGMSKTGSGKTAAFGVPLLEKIMPGAGLQVLIMAPTRELAVQISQELRKFGKYKPCNVVTIYGGVAIGPQMDQLVHAEIVVGTPGRLKDHLQRRTMDLSKLNCMVLDEADKMVEMGFVEDIEDIISCTPAERQMLLFGATISDEIDRIKAEHMHRPETAEAESYVADDYLEQYYYEVKQHEKFSLLVHLLKKEKIERTIIFCSKRSTVEMVAKNLRQQGIKSEMLHGLLSQNRRLRVLENFDRGKIDVLVASAVAARGLDIKDITHIFNYDLSQDPQEYVHRVGRTARAGEKGKAITLLCDKDYGVFNQILDRYPLKVEGLPVENFQRLRFDTGQPRQRFGSRGFDQRAGDYRRNNDQRRSNPSGNGYRQSNTYRRNNREYSPRPPYFSGRREAR